jgi:hypothetical protein
LAIETTYGEIGTTDRLDPRRGTGLILVVGNDEVRWGIRPFKILPVDSTAALTAAYP